MQKATGYYMRSSHSKLGLPVIIPGFKTNLVSQVPLGFQTQVSAEVAQGVLEILQGWRAPLSSVHEMSLKRNHHFLLKISVFLSQPFAQ